MSQGNMVFLRLYVQYKPPIIGILYKNKASDEKKKMYKILLQRLVLNPDPMQAAQQLFLQHPHMLKANKIPKQKIAALVQKIQRQLRIDEDYDEQQEQQQQRQDESEQGYEHGEEQQHEEKEHYRAPEPKKESEAPQKKRPKFDFDKQFGRDDGPLNKSL